MKVFIVFAIALLSVASARRGQPEYHWRDFNGTVPRDALKVKPQNGGEEYVYVGQGYFKGVGLLPGMLKRGEQKMTVVAKDQIVTTDRNIMIMCTDSRYTDTDFQWIPMNFQNFESMKTLEFLNVPEGGTEADSVVYIGRHSASDYGKIGKISTVAPYEGLNVEDSEGKPVVYKNFELLALLNFNCDEEGRRSSEGSYGNSHKTGSSTRRSSRHHYDLGLHKSSHDSASFEN